MGAPRVVHCNSQTRDPSSVCRAATAAAGAAPRMLHGPAAPSTSICWPLTSAVLQGVGVHHQQPTGPGVAAAGRCAAATGCGYKNDRCLGRGGAGAGGSIQKKRRDQSTISVFWKQGQGGPGTCTARIRVGRGAKGPPRSAGRPGLEACGGLDQLLSTIRQHGHITQSHMGRARRAARTRGAPGAGAGRLTRAAAAAPPLPPAPPARCRRPPRRQRRRGRPRAGPSWSAACCRQTGRPPRRRRGQSL